VFVASDWSTVELVTLAQTCIDWFGWSHLGDAIREGRDAHEELGSTIAGFDIRGHEMRNTYRTLAKAPNFGYPGGLGAERFVAWANATYGDALKGSGIVIDAAFARTLKRHWLQQWPEMRLYHKRIGALSKPITMALDRTGYVRGGMGFTDASNFPFQGLAAAAAKDAGWDLFVLSVTDGLCGGWPVLLVHDEYVVEVPEERAHECAAIVERVMIDALARLCPDVPGGVETMILKRYTK
jgi:DNA polymerase-1